MDQVEKVKIPASLLSALYKDVLIDASMPSSSEGKKAMRAVIVAMHSNEKIEKEANELLSGILTACKLDNSNAAVLYTDKESETDLQFIKTHYTTSIVILFGIAPAAFGLPINFPPFQIQQVDNIQFVASPALEEMISDKSLKMQLWNCLKQIFIG